MRTVPSSSRHRRALGRVARLVAAIHAALAVSAAFADDDNDIATDRPDFVESSQVVGKGVFQFETGIVRERDRSDGIKTTLRSTPTLLRYGLSDSLEIRLETDGALRQTVTGPTGSDTSRGTGDASIGLKWHLRDADAASGRPSLALLAHLDLDSGSSEFRAAGTVPSVRMVAEWELGGDASFGVMPGLAYQKDDASGKRYWSGILAATYSRPLVGPLRGFVEVAGQELKSKRHGGSIVTFDTGVAYAIDSDTQLDLSINLGLNRDTPDRAIGIGFSRRFR